MSERREVKQNIGDFQTCGTVADLITELKELQEEYPDDKLFYDIETTSDYYEGPSYAEVTVYFKRPENDKEYNDRISRQKKWDEEQRLRDLKEFERLQKLYGDKK